MFEMKPVLDKRSNIENINTEKVMGVMEVLTVKEKTIKEITKNFMQDISMQ